MAVISGFIILGVGEILAPILLGMMNVPDDVLKLATLYLRIFFFAMPFSRYMTLVRQCLGARATAPDLFTLLSPQAL